MPNSNFKTCNSSIITRSSAATPTRFTNYSALQELTMSNGKNFFNKYTGDP